ncbi:S8 family serine peptidase [Brassicibacter mesophilus]|uniref:S8 family serine peptidase n=1 Tax=Brassicibacter mesophilus TaxID=745119 RepID=UPI003D2460F8
MKERLPESSYSNSHGTTCAAIIRKYYKKGILSSIKILDENDLGSKQRLIRAIEWCIDNKVDIVHLSIGSVYYGDKKELQKIIDKANDFGLLIIAANKNEDVITYPASFHNVIGVKSQRHKSLEEGQYTYTFKPFDGIEITSCGSHLLENYKGKQYTTQNCNSFAAPMITAMVAEIIENLSNYSIELIKKILWEKSNNYNEDMPFYQSYNSLEWIKNALIFTTYDNQLSVKNYIFNIKEIISINLNTKLEMFREVFKYLKYHKYALNDIDTVIVESDINIHDSFTEDILLQLFNYFDFYRKSIVFLSPESNNLVIVSSLDISIKPIYYNLLSQSNYMKIEQNQDKPIILVYGEIWYNVLNVLSQINDELMKRGYIPIVLTDDIRGAYFGYHHFFVQEEKLFNYDTEINEKVNNFIGIYNGDIGLIGFSGFSKDNNFVEKIKKVLDIDIVILVDVNKENFLYNEALDESSTIILSDHKLHKDSYKAVVDRILEMYEVQK